MLVRILKPYAIYPPEASPKKLGITQGAMGHYKLPEPDVIIGNRYKGWTEETINTWIASRPGRGARTDLRASTEDK